MRCNLPGSTGESIEALVGDKGLPRSSALLDRHGHRPIGIYWGRHHEILEVVDRIVQGTPAGHIAAVEGVERPFDHSDRQAVNRRLRATGLAAPQSVQSISALTGGVAARLSPRCCGATTVAWTELALYGSAERHPRRWGRESTRRPQAERCSHLPRRVSAKPPRDARASRGLLLVWPGGSRPELHPLRLTVLRLHIVGAVPSAAVRHDPLC